MGNLPVAYSGGGPAEPNNPYLPDPALVEAVNLALHLERPLLLKGEPGSGKTRLARAVAHELGMPYEEWPVKSVSRARDGLYVYDAVGRLRDAHLAAAGRWVGDPDRLDAPETYVRWGPLGRAFRSERRAVVLIDEIDKADIDFPNDLLLELDQRRFTVEETGQEVQAQHAPLIFITSNDEKDLPDAFLRRCLFHYIAFPDRDRLLAIVQAHLPALSEGLREAAVERFSLLRERMVQDKGDAGKKVSTGELLDWARALATLGEEQALRRLQAGGLPFAGALLKSQEDQAHYAAVRAEPRL